MSKLIDIYGDRGDGKTILLAYFGVKSDALKIPVIADYKLDVPMYQKLNIDELITMKYMFATVEFDELDVYLNNRRSMSNLSMFINNIAIKQSRKRGIDVLGSTQLFDTIDWRFTQMTNCTIVAYGRTDIKKYHKEFFRYDVVFKSIWGNRIRQLMIPTDFMETLYDRYDTDEPIMPQDVREMALEVADQKTLKKEVERVANKILDKRAEYNLDNEKLTEKKLRFILLDLEEPETLAFYLSEYLKLRLA